MTTLCYRNLLKTVLSLIIITWASYYALATGPRASPLLAAPTELFFFNDSDDSDFGLNWDSFVTATLDGLGLHPTHDIPPAAIPIRQASTWIINEIHADPLGSTATDLAGDANNDGIRHATEDEFIELINNTGGTVDISDWTLADGITVQYTFPGGTHVPDQCSIIVFGGGTPTGTFGGALVQTAASLNLNNGGDTVTLQNSGGITQATYTYGGEGGDDQSLTRDLDIVGADPLVKHSTATASGGVLFSPGTQINGSSFSGCNQPYVKTTTPTAGTTGVAINTSINIQFSEAVTTTVNTFDLECPIGTTIAFNTTPIPPGSADNFTLTPTVNLPHNLTCTITINKDEVTDQDGVPDKMAADYVFTFTTVTPASAWIINEIHADPSSTGLDGDANNDGLRHATEDEFIELINNTGGTVDISGWTLADGNSVRHTFPGETQVPDQCAIVVFGGGTPTGTFGDALVQTAASLGLNNGGDTITFQNSGGITQATYTYGSEGGDNQSLTRDLDLIGPDPLVKHSSATASGGTLFSPGTQINGALFSGCSRPHVIKTTPAGNTVGVMVNTTIDIQFNEAVTITANTFALECPLSTAITFTVSPPPPGQVDTFALTPAANLPYNTNCTITVNKDEVTDQDDTPENMFANYVFSFTSAAVVEPILISEFVYDGTTFSTEGDEFVELCNPNPTTVDLTGYKIGDEETQGGNESMYEIPISTTLASNTCLIIAKNAADFQARYSFPPTFEVAALTKYSAWGNGNWALANDGDELLLLGPGDQILDSVAYRNGDFTALGLEGGASASEPNSLQRVWPLDTNSMPHDFVKADPTPGLPTLAPAPPPVPPAPATLPDGMFAYWGHLHAHTTYSDGAGPPHYALAVARSVGLHFYAITDHGWWLQPLAWSKTLSQTEAATVPGEFIALRGIEWTHSTVGHINIFNSNTLLNRTDPVYDDLADFYSWLAANPNAIAQFNHPDPTYGGTFQDFAFNAGAAPLLFMQEIGNRARAYTTYESSFIQANMAGWRVAPANNSDTHSAAWGSDHPPRTGLVAPSLTKADLLAAMQARRVFATEDSNLALALRLNGFWMGSVLTTSGTLSLTVDVLDPDNEAATLYIYDNNLLLTQTPLSGLQTQWAIQIKTLPGHFYWVKLVQADGDRAYSAPIWFAGQAPIDTILVNELLPAPNSTDWDNDGTADFNDEWIELYNPLDRTVGLGGWRLQDAAGVTYQIPLSVTIAPAGFVLFYKAQTGIGLNNDGDTATLFHPNGTAIDTFTYQHSPGYDESWCRLPDGGSRWHDDCFPTPWGANLEILPPGPLKVKIAAAKKLAFGAWIQTKGSVTAPPDVLGQRTMYIQDDTAGIMIFLPTDHSLFLKPGDVVEVEGYLKSYFEEFEIVALKKNGVSFVESGPAPPPLPIETGALLEPYEGRLVMLQAPVVAFRGRSTMWLDDSSGWAKVVIRGSTGIKKPFINYGTPLTVVGIVSQRSSVGDASRDDYRLFPRYQFDLVFSQPDPTPQLSAAWPAFLPETGY